MENEYLASEGLYNPNCLATETANHELFGSDGNVRCDKLKKVIVRPQDWLNDGRTLISRQWHYVMPTCLAAYIFLQILFSTQTHFCSRIEPFADWTFHVGVGVASCFCLSVCCNVINAFAVESWAQKETEHLRAVYAGAATMSMIAGSSSVVTLLGDTVCRDAFGLETPKSQWPEWLIAAPLLVYITIAIEDKRNLTIEDATIIFLMFLCVLFGFLMNVHVSLTWGIVLFVLSSLCMTMDLFLAMKAGRHTKQFGPSQLRAQQWFLERMRTKSRLAKLLFWILPFFMLIHILGKEDE